MDIPRWVVFLIAVWVLSFGAYRLSIPIRRRNKDPDTPNLQRRGLWAQSSRRHLLFGILYLILGGYLVAMGFGYGIDIRRLGGGQSSAPSPDPSRPSATE